MECFNQRGEAEYLSPNENILSNARMKIFIICFIRHQNGSLTRSSINVTERFIKLLQIQY